MIKENEIPIPVYVINLQERQDRLAHIQNQFIDKPEFNLIIVTAIKNQIGAIGLWQNILNIINQAKYADYEYIILCEDDHQFLANYDKIRFLKAINEAQKNGAHVLLGGVSWFMDALQISKTMFWVDQFTGLQFTVIFQSFFNDLLETTLEPHGAADHKIAALTDNKFVIYPFISSQREFGYSDVTHTNNKVGYVTKLFENSLENLSQLEKVSLFYHHDLF